MILIGQMSIKNSNAWSGPNTTELGDENHYKWNGNDRKQRGEEHALAKGERISPIVHRDNGSHHGSRHSSDQCDRGRLVRRKEEHADAEHHSRHHDEAHEGGQAFLEKRKPDWTKFPKLP